MTSPASTSVLGSEFNGFLQALIYDDKNGGLLSVLSALARLNLDPWKEAADLAQLPKEFAAGRLASLLARLPANPSMPADMGVLAARLIRLLPRGAKPMISARDIQHGDRKRTAPARPNYVVFLMLLASIVLSLSIASSHQYPAPTANASAPASATSSKQVPGTSIPDR